MANDIYAQTDEEKKNNGVNTQEDAAKQDAANKNGNGAGQEADAGKGTGGDASPSGASNQGEDAKKDDNQAATGTWTGDVDDSVDDQRTLNIVESDGTKVTLVMHFPSIPEAENISDAGIRMYVDEEGKTIQMPRTGDLHAALMNIFGTAKVNGAIKNVNFGLFKSLERKTYNFAMVQANSFLDSLTDAFKG